MFVLSEFKVSYKRYTCKRQGLYSIIHMCFQIDLVFQIVVYLASTVL
jgi:hypothetical protein